MVKFEIDELHKIAQMGKECCEHLLEYANNSLYETVNNQLKSYEEQMHKMEQIYVGTEDISSAKSKCYSIMMKTRLSRRHNTYDLVKALLKGNIMGQEALADFIQCPFNSDESKELAIDMLKAVTKNINSLLNDFYYNAFEHTCCKA